MWLNTVRATWRIKWLGWARRARRISTSTSTHGGSWGSASRERSEPGQALLSHPGPCCALPTPLCPPQGQGPTGGLGAGPAGLLPQALLDAGLDVT